MKRRQVLKGIAAGSALSLGIGGAAADSGARQVDISEFDRVLVKEGDRVVETVEAPTWDDVKRLNSETTADQQVVTPDDDCVEFCRSNCSTTCDSCAYGCFNCCNPEEEICSCCSEVDDPDSTECCEGC
ncbi:hypothetical protein NGM10_00565 [Halorussus salilacus]|uniref:hypothetical protein n=1 Tax=Halorussus salilacus TaxID=2953750 RepID=UPI00209F0C22|nr:hypothetical protein [Halorussus salilacus]USZ68249.1 hypothetical protein NGM10_00565 [Halorussus salilacus]